MTDTQRILDQLATHQRDWCAQFRLPRWMQGLVVERVTSGARVYGVTNHIEVPALEWYRQPFEEALDGFAMSTGCVESRIEFREWEEDEEPEEVDEDLAGCFADAMLRLATKYPGLREAR